MKKIIINEQQLKESIKKIILEYIGVSNSLVSVYSKDDFNKTMENLGLNDSNVDKYFGTYAMISIGSGPSRSESENLTNQHYFKYDHINVLNLDFDDNTDTGSRYKKSGGKEDAYYNDEPNKKLIVYKNPILFTKKMAKQIKSFVNKNIGAKFLIHCMMGQSRSAAIGREIIKYINGNIEEFEKIHQGQFRHGTNRFGHERKPNALVTKLLKKEFDK